MKMMLLFGLAGLPDTWYEVLFLPLFFSFVGIAIWLAGRNAELKDHARPWKWGAAVPFLIALFAGWGTFVNLRDSFYEAAIQPYGKKMQMAHYAAFLVPALCLVFLAAWEVFERKRAAQE